ncbi:zinc-ribbon domain-containing protein [bacterium]|nr:zinc-ribbon domain-containing protein [bacterium]
MPIIFYGLKQIHFDRSADGHIHSACPGCGQTGSLKPVKKVTFIHIFWIPLIPVWFKNNVKCSQCGYTGKEKQQALQR